MKQTSLAIAILFTLIFSTSLFSEEITYSHPWGKGGYTIQESDKSGMVFSFSIQKFAMNEIQVNGSSMKVLELPGSFLPNDIGAPNLPGMGRFVVVPKGAKPMLRVLDYRTDLIKDVDLAPAPEIPFDNQKGPLIYNANKDIYSRSENYPAQPFQISSVMNVRGVNVAVVGITPFQYNPKTRDLTIYRDVRVEVAFKGGDENSGDSRLRSRWWDPIIKNMVLNPELVPPVEYRGDSNAGKTGAEYIIITLDDPVFIDYAHKIRHWRTLQGITSKVVTISEVGGNTTEAIESYVDNAYNNWDIPPVAVLLLGDYSEENGNGIVSPIYDHYCVSDNIYADVDGDHLPDITFARITAQNETHLKNTVDKFLNYEASPPISAGFYNHPITAMGWQTARWFQICSESINGFWEHQLGKSPVRQNAIYSGSTDVWSTAQNTETILKYFGPRGLDYLPGDPTHLVDFDANVESMNAAINAGAFMIQHRDHGSDNGWGEPDYEIEDLAGLTTTEPPYVFSINCLTGKYNNKDEVFAEAFHRHPNGALGVLAASEVSYSFVNDTFVWGMYDNMWPNFLPDYGRAGEVEANILPAFANVAGKLFLKQSAWPYNTENKQVTYHLFHHHGDAFSTVYSEIPQMLSVTHGEKLFAGQSQFTVNVDPGAFISLTVDGEIIGLAEGTGAPFNVQIAPQLPGSKLIITITKQNFYRYQKEVQIVPADGAYVTLSDYIVEDNNNGQVDYGETVDLSIKLKNIGKEESKNLKIVLTSNSSHIKEIAVGSLQMDSLAPETEIGISKAFKVSFNDNVSDQAEVDFVLTVTDDSGKSYDSYFSLPVNAPAFKYELDLNGNDIIYPGESREFSYIVTNVGHADAHNLKFTLSELLGAGVTVVGDGVELAELPKDESREVKFVVEVGQMILPGTPAIFLLEMKGDQQVEQTFQHSELIGITDDFESADFSNVGWEFTGTGEWTVSDENVYAGLYSARTAEIVHKETTKLSLTVEIITPGSISFYKKVSSEKKYDFFEFYINGELAENWSGEVDWSYSEYALEKGTNVLEWHYKKDGSVDKGLDGALIDNVLIKGMKP